eukprot:UN13881
MALKPSKALRVIPRSVQKRYVSRQVWDIYGNVNNLEAKQIRHGSAYEMAEEWPWVKQAWKLLVLDLYFILFG